MERETRAYALLITTTKRILPITCTIPAPLALNNMIQLNHSKRLHQIRIRLALYAPDQPLSSAPLPACRAQKRILTSKHLILRMRIYDLITQRPDT